MILGGIANQALTLRERDIQRSGAVTLVVGDDFNAIVLPDTNATEWERLSEKTRGEEREERSSHVGCAEILTTHSMLSCRAHSSPSVVRCPHASGCHRVEVDTGWYVQGWYAQFPSMGGKPRFGVQVKMQTHRR